MSNPRPFADVRAILLERAQHHRNPFLANLDPSAIASTLERLESVEPQAWVDAFAALAAPHQATASVAERAGDATTAAREYQLAYAYWRAARYPAPHSSPKREAYRAPQQMYLKAPHL